MRIAIYFMALTTLANSSAMCSEVYSYLSKYSAVYASCSENPNINTTLIKQGDKGYKIAENDLRNNKYSRSIKKRTSPEGSVELIEMIKNAKSKKESVKLKDQN